MNTYGGEDEILARGVEHKLGSDRERERQLVRTVMKIKH